MMRMRRELLILLLVIVFFTGIYIVTKNIVLKETGGSGITPPDDPDHICEIDNRKTKKHDAEGYDRATCTHAGFYMEEYYCYCGAKLGEELKSEKALGHSMNGNECSRCDLLVESQGLNYKLIDGSYYAVVGMGSCKDTTLVIPEKYEGLPVRRIEYQAFSGNSRIVKVIIPDSIGYIGESAFYGCSSLKNVLLGNGVTYVGKNAFYGCSNLEYNIHSTARYLGSLDNPYIALMGAESKEIVSCEINPDTKIIVDGAFEDCSLLREIVIPDRVKYVGKKAFYNCYNMLSLTLGSAVNEIGTDAFKYCHKLVEVYDLSDKISVRLGYADEGYVGFYALDVYTSADAVSKLEARDDYVFYVGNSLYLMSYIGEDTVITLPETVDYDVYSHAFSNLKITGVTVSEGIETIGTYAFKNCRELKDVSLPESLTAVSEGVFEGCIAIEGIVIPDAVVSIGGHAFSGCEALKSITIPEGVSAINSHCFMDCTALESVNVKGVILSVGDHAFDGCELLGAFDLSRVSTVGNYAFNECYALTVVKLDSVKTVGDHAFSGVSVSELIIPTTTTYVGSHAFAGCKELVSLVAADGRSASLEFGDYAFTDCEKLAKASIGGKVYAISDGMFSECNSLSEITLGADVKKIGEMAFYYCTDLVSVKLPYNVGSIGDMAFSGCYRLGKVTVNNNLTTIGAHAFDSCYNLMSFTVPAKVTSIGEGAFYNCLKLVEVTLNENLTDSCVEESYLTAYALNVRDEDSDPVHTTTSGSYVYYVDGAEIYLVGYIGNSDSITLPESLGGKSYQIYPYAFYRYGNLVTVDFSNSAVTLISEHAFAECNNLTAVKISDSLCEISKYAFANCENLSQVELSDASQLRVIGAYAFYECESLTAINLGNALVSVDEHAFHGCDLKELYLGNSISTLGVYAFANNSNLERVKFTGPVSYIGDYAFIGCDNLTALSIDCGNEAVIGISAFESTSITDITLPEGFVSVKINAFAGCTLVESISLPSTLEEIEHDAFFATSPSSISVAEGNEVYKSDSGCLVDIGKSTVILGSNSATIPDGVKIIGENAFYGSSVESIDLSGIVRINDGAFGECFGLAEVKLGSNLISLGGKAFYKCRALEAIVIPADLTEISSYAFEGCASLATVTISEGVKVIGKGAFKASGASALTIGEGVELIDDEAFMNCTDLRFVEIPEGVKIIGRYAFSGCDTLTEVVIDQGTEEIGNYCFSDCELLEKITLPGTVKLIGASAFSGCPLVKTIIFIGTKTQFNTVSIEIGNDIFSDKKVSVYIIK